MEIVHVFDCFEDDMPEQRKDAELLLEKLTELAAIAPPAKLKQKVLAKLSFEGDELNMSNLPVIDKYANYLSWLNVLQPILPTALLVISTHANESHLY